MNIEKRPGPGQDVLGILTERGRINHDQNHDEETKKDLIRRRSNELLKNRESLEETISFGEYMDRLDKSPKIAQLSHARVYSMLSEAGVEQSDDNKTVYKFFEGKIFGLEKPLEDIYNYFESSAKRMETRKRILLLMGPVGGGKSTISALIKKGLEEYSKNEKGAAYAIKDCPMHEEPLHLIPDIEDPETHENPRKMVEELYGVHIEGDLCPSCQYKLKENEGNYWDFQVERFIFSEKDRKGVGTFLPSDPKSQDISELVGSIDLSTIGEFGSESDPRAYKFDGELNVANRGVMEFIEMLKSDEKFLYSLLTVTQEQNIKIGRFALIYADEVIVTHTNENEYKAFLDNKKAEALQDRMIVVKVPYNLKASDERKIYGKLIDEAGLNIGKNPEKGEVHVAPHVLDLAANFAVLSRLAEDPKITPMKKLKLYNGEEVEGFGEKDLKELQEEAEDEGMQGISPRYVINCLASALTGSETNNGNDSPKKTCLTPIDAIRKLRDSLDSSPSIKREERQKIKEKILPEIKREYDEKAVKDVEKAFISGYDDLAMAHFDNYFDNIDAYCNNKKRKDPVTGDDVEPDEKMMRAIEEQIGVTEGQKKTFREEVMIRLSSMLRRGKDYDYTSHPKLKEAIEKKVMADCKDIVKTTLTATSRNPEQKGKLDKVTEHLVNEEGYCPHCAEELLQYVSQLLNR